jgi:hypothetical protein
VSTRIPAKLRVAVLDRDDHSCCRCGVSLEGSYYSLHHRRRKGAGGSKLLDTMANLVTLCGTGTTGCHGYIEEHRAACYTLGWLVPNGATPEAWPVLRLGSWQQPGDTWTAAAPHPRQLELGGTAA